MLRKISNQGTVAIEREGVAGQRTNHAVLRPVSKCVTAAGRCCHRAGTASRKGATATDCAATIRRCAHCDRVILHRQTYIEIKTANIGRSVSCTIMCAHVPSVLAAILQLATRQYIRYSCEWMPYVRLRIKDQVVCRTIESTNIQRVAVSSSGRLPVEGRCQCPHRRTWRGCRSRSDQSGWRKQSYRCCNA